MFLKVCGITRPEDAQKAEELGFSSVGFIFDEWSSRSLSIEQAAALETGNILRVGVFTTRNPYYVLDAAYKARLDLIQLHADQKPDFIDYLVQHLERDRIVRAIWPYRYDTEEELLLEARRYRTRCGALLVDGGFARGGWGEKVNVNELVPLDWPLPWLLAGGLDADSVSEIAALPEDRRPVGMDFNSKLEVVVNGLKNEGIKDHEKMAEVMKRARELGLYDGTRLPPFVHSEKLLKVKLSGAPK